MRSSPSEPVARRLAAIAGFYRYATDEDLIDRSPVAGRRRRPVAGRGRARPGAGHGRARWSGCRQRLWAGARRRPATGDRRPVDEVFVGGVAVEAGDRGQAPGHGFGGARPHALWSYFCRLDHVHVELCEPHELAEPDLARRPVPGHQAGRVCRFWALACGVTEVVIRWKEPEDILCRRHRRWSRWASASWGW